MGIFGGGVFGGGGSGGAGSGAASAAVDPNNRGAFVNYATLVARVFSPTLAIGNYAYAGGIRYEWSGTIWIDNSASPVRYVTADATLSYNDEYIEVDATAGDVIITLPSTTLGVNGRHTAFTIKRSDGVLAQSVTIQAVGSDSIETINTLTAITLPAIALGRGVCLVLARAQGVWRIIS